MYASVQNLSLSATPQAHCTPNSANPPVQPVPCTQPTPCSACSVLSQTHFLGQPPCSANPPAQSPFPSAWPTATRPSGSRCTGTSCWEVKETEMQSKTLFCNFPRGSSNLNKAPVLQNYWGGNYFFLTWWPRLRGLSVSTMER